MRQGFVRWKLPPSLQSALAGGTGRFRRSRPKPVVAGRHSTSSSSIRTWGGRSQATRLNSRSTVYCEEMSEMCGFPHSRCVTLTPRHTMEAWALADPEAVLRALGYTGSATDIGLPRDGREAEGIADPKATLDLAVRRVTNNRRRRGHSLLPAIAQHQRIDALRQAPSFRDSELRLQAALRTLGTLRTE